MASLVLALAMVACGGKEETSAAGTTVVATSAATTVAPTTSAPPATTSTSSPTATTGTRSPVSTTTIGPLADTSVGRNDVPESTISYSFGPTRINGVSHVNALIMRTETRPQKVEIDAGRNRNRFRGVLGIPDDQPSASFHQVEISLDNGPPVYSTVVNFGEAKDIDLDVRGVLRIRVTVTAGQHPCCDTWVVAIGNPRLS